MLLMTTDSDVSCIIAKADCSQYIFGSRHDVMLPESTLLWRNTISQFLHVSGLANTCMYIGHNAHNASE